ncbi:MAG: FdrA protein, partial [Alphaproteobacteria bacterium]|nr:FdrA protein [Alphaproteobacteria bacterium]
MSSTLLNELRRGFYADSVALMRLSRALARLPGVSEAAMMMATPANKEILRDAQLLGEGSAGAANDLIIAVRAQSEDAARAALAEAAAELAKPRSAPEELGAAFITRNLRGGLRRLPDASLALISIPGDFAIAEARKAIRSGLDVMIFS